MIRKFLIFGLVVSMWSCKQGASVPGSSASDTTATANNVPFPDFGFMEPGYQGVVFKLSQDYPDTLSTAPLPDFFKIDYKKDWRKYLDSVKSYCFKGNTEVDFRVENNKLRKWYHMPWQHYGKNGREGFHGLTQEAPVKPYQLAPTQTIDTSGAIAVGLYNDVAAYTIGQVWKDHYNPDSLHNVSFKNGAVLFKLLFVTLPEKNIAQQVPFLDNGIWWDAYAATNFKKPYNRHRAKVVLIQMDIMVRDDNAPNGWVFGNFQYNGKLNHPNKWDNLIPVGIMWGEDPTDTTNASNPRPTKTIINPNLKETIINPDTKELPATHLGWNSRLNGPVDNPMSSCYSCHSTAESPELTPQSPLFLDSAERAKYPVGSPAWMQWFRNLKCGVPFDPDAKSMDFSLQLASSISYFNLWKATQSGLFASSYPNKQGVAVKSNLVLKTKTARKKVKEYIIAFPVPK
ncbi:MAG: hypothetical protein ACHQIM_06815 [Sphingobacteriales bacterium]